MLFARINRSNPEKMFIVAYNSWSTASLTNGQAVQWDYATDADGVGVTKPGAIATAAGLAIAGIAADTIASGDYGLVQVYGYHSAVRVRTMTTTGTTPHIVAAVAAGTPLSSPIATVFCLEGMSTASTSPLLFPAGFALAAQASFTTKAIAVFLKCL